MLHPNFRRTRIFSLKDARPAVRELDHHPGAGDVQVSGHRSSGNSAVKIFLPARVPQPVGQLVAQLRQPVVAQPDALLDAAGQVGQPSRTTGCTALSQRVQARSGQPLPGTLEVPARA